MVAPGRWMRWYVGTATGCITIDNLKLARFKEIFPGKCEERSDRCAQGIGAISAQ